MATKKSFLRWALVNVIFFCVIAAAVASYHLHLHIIVKIMAVVVLGRFAVASVRLGAALFKDKEPDVRDLSLASKSCLKLGVLSMALGALVALQGGLNDIQSRVLGATTGLAITALAVGCSLVLDHLHHWSTNT